MKFIILCVLSCAPAIHAQVQSFISNIPSMVQPQFDAAWNVLKEISAMETNIEDFDIHSIPYGEEVLCKACNLTFDFLISAHKFFIPEQVLKVALADLCLLIYTKPVCDGIIELNVPIFIEIAKRKPDLNSYQVCGTIFEQYCGKKPVVEWSIDIPQNNKHLKKRDSHVSKKYSDSKDVDTIEIVHVTDTHVDIQYSAGSKGSGCREPICCRAYQGEAKSAENTAGLWGNYPGCDIPMATAENAFAEVASSHKKIKYIYMTGDLIAHNLWETTRESNMKQIHQQATAFHEMFGDTMVFPVMGNHEPHPANVLPPPDLDVPEYSGEWLYEVFYESWCKNFPPETKATFMRGGFYTISPEPGFRVIGLNSLFGYVYNWFMILDPVDPGGQLVWLKDVLLEAERNQERVHILMHAPSTELDTLQVWSREYHRLLERFQDTIAGQFLGHTHRDQFYLFYGQDTSSGPFSVAWNGGSITTFTNANPNYKVYLVNQQNFMVEDIHTYIFNLTEANLNKDIPPRWFRSYSFREAYDIPSLQLKDMNIFIKTMAADEKVFRKYFLNYMKNSDVAHRKSCRSNCQNKQLCKIASTRNSTQCRSALYDAAGNN